MPDPSDIAIRLIIICLATLTVLSWIVLWVGHGSLKSTDTKLRISEARVSELQEQLRSVGLRRDKTGKLRSTYTVRDER